MHPLMMAIISICMSVAAQFSLKAGMSSDAVKAAMAQPSAFSTGLTLLTQPWLLVGFALYGLGAVVWLSVLLHWDVSKAYPLVGLGFAFTVLIGFVIGESVTLQRAGGAALICAGVWIIAQT